MVQGLAGWEHLALISNTSNYELYLLEYYKYAISNDLAEGAW